MPVPASDSRTDMTTRLFRFTMNINVRGVDDDVFDQLAGSVLDQLLGGKAAGEFLQVRVLGRTPERLLKVIVEFPSVSHNTAHRFGFEKVAETFDRLGLDTSSWFGEPHVAVTEDDGIDEWDVLVERLKGATVTFATTGVDLVPA